MTDKKTGMLRIGEVSIPIGKKHAGLTKPLVKLTKSELLELVMILVDRITELEEGSHEMEASMMSLSSDVRQIREDRDRTYQNYAASIHASNQLTETVERQEKNIQTLIDIIRKKEGLDK